MAVKELVKDESVLSQVCEAAGPEDAAAAQDLIDTMASLDDAACLHANQIGVTKSLFAYVDDRDNVHVMYNPAIKLGLAASKQVEGCFTRDDVTTMPSPCADSSQSAGTMTVGAWECVEMSKPFAPPIASEIERP